MSHPNKETKKNNGHNGFIWSKRLLIALLASLFVLISQYGPAVAAGIGYVGGR
jgi:hypothetical protein